MSDPLGRGPEPRVSVVMSVHNCDPGQLRSALESVLTQTLRDLELVVVNDGSTDETAAVLSSVDDKRVRVVERPHRGLSSSLNDAIGQARGPYVARMDADDVARPDRLALQASFLDAHPEHVMVGSSFELVDSETRPIRVEPALTEDEDLRREMFLRNPFGHGTVMMRRDAAGSVGGYEDRYPAAEDFDLWRRLARRGSVANLPAVLYRWRVHPGSVSRTESKAQRASTQRILEECWRDGRPFPMGRRAIRDRVRQYARLDAALAPVLVGRYRQVVLALGLQMIRRGRTRDGMRQLASFLGSGPGSVPAAMVFGLSRGRVAGVHDVRRKLGHGR